MKIIILLLFVSLNILNAQNNFSLNVGEIKEKQYHTSFDFEDIKGKIIIDVKINNKNRKFILDTGAPTSISANLLSELNYKTVKKSLVYDANNKVNELEIVEIPEISINGLSFLNSYALKISDMSNLECFNIDGIIGSNTLRNSVVNFDFQNNKITITDNLKNLGFSKLKAHKLFFIDKQSSPFLQVNLKLGNTDGKIMVLLDSGDDSFYTLSKNAYNQIMTQVRAKLPQKQMENSDYFKTLDIIASSKGSFTFSLHGNDDPNIYYKFKVKELNFGNTSFENIISTTTYGNASRIGSEILYHGQLTLDYKKQKYYFQPYDSISKININHKIKSFNPTFENNKFIVGIVWDDELRGRMKIGDEILKINDVNFANLAKCEIYRMSMDDFKESNKLIVTLKDFETNKIKVIEVAN